MKDISSVRKYERLSAKLGNFTTPDITGPFYVGGAPMRDRFSGFEASGEPLVIFGRVLGPQGEAIEGATVDLWQADHKGEYDFTDKFLFRGKVISGADGRYRIPTVLPGSYCDDGRWRVKHIHFTAGAKRYIEVTSQIYFTEDEYLSNDPWASADAAKSRTLELQKLSDGSFQAHFDIYLDSEERFLQFREGEELGYLLTPEPDPFDDAVLLEFGLFEGGILDARIFDTQGELTYVMTGGPRKAGRHLIHWEGKKLDKSLAPSGSYRAVFSLDGRPFGETEFHIERN